ncbi:MAG: hypothetical protein AAGF11_48670 [Myxococcota bacterium]
MPSRLPLITRRAYLDALDTGRYPWTMAPRTSWRQRLRAVDLASAAATTIVLGSCSAGNAGDYDLGVYRGTTLITTVSLTFGGATAPDLATAIADAFTAAGGAGQPLEQLLDSATQNTSTFTITWRAGENLRVAVDAQPSSAVSVEHVVEVDLNALLSGNNAFPVNVMREADPYIRVITAFPAGTVVTVDEGLADSDVLVDVPCSAVGTFQTASSSTLGEGDELETAWEPLAALELGSDPSPSSGELELVVPFSPLLAPEALP